MDISSSKERITVVVISALVIGALIGLGIFQIWGHGRDLNSSSITSPLEQTDFKGAPMP